MSSLVSVCNLPNLFAYNSVAADLASKFCTCPAAMSVLKKGNQNETFVIKVGDFPTPSAITTYTDEYYPKSHEIKIPYKNIKSKEALSSLAFEVFNAKTADKQSDALRRATAGELGMDPFAQKIEEREIFVMENLGNLLEECAPDWKDNLAPNILKTIRINNGLELRDRLLLQDMQCHTDSIREKWLNQFKRSYCTKHPQDKRSCSTKVAELCDFNKLSLMPEKERTEITKERICKFTPQASKKLKDILSFYKDYCPDVFEEIPPAQETISKLDKSDL